MKISGLFRPPLMLVFPVGYKINRTKENSDHFNSRHNLHFWRTLRSNLGQFDVVFNHNLHFFDILRVTLGQLDPPRFRRQLRTLFRF